MENKRRLMRIRQTDGTWKYVKRATITGADGRTGVYFEDEEIEFADDYVKQKLLEYGIGGDGKITYLDAFKCKALPRRTDPATGNTYQLFEGDTVIRSFDEIRYFGITKIHSHEFYACTNLKSIVMDGYTRTIDQYAFSDTDNVTSLRIGRNVTSIKGSALLRRKGDYTNLTDVSVDERNPYFKLDEAMWELYGVNEAGEKDKIFFILSKLAGEYTVSPKIETLNGYTFAYQNQITKFVFGSPSSLQEIGDYCFYNCSGLTQPMEIPEGVRRIGYRAFYYMDIGVSLPSTVETIGTDIFGHYKSPRYLHVNEANPKFKMVSGVLYEYHDVGEVSVPFRAICALSDGSQNDVVLPGTLTTSDMFCFTCMPRFKSLTIDADIPAHLDILRRLNGGFLADRLVVNNATNKDMGVLDYIGLNSGICEIVINAKEGETLTKYALTELGGGMKVLLEQERKELLYVMSAETEVDLRGLDSSIVNFGHPDAKGQYSLLFVGCMSFGCPNVDKIYFPEQAGYQWYQSIFAYTGFTSTLQTRLRYINITVKLLDDLYDGMGGGTYDKLYNCKYLGIDASGAYNSFADDFLDVARAWYGESKAYSISLRVSKKLYMHLNETYVTVEGERKTYLDAYGGYGITIYYLA